MLLKAVAILLKCAVCDDEITIHEFDVSATFNDQDLVHLLQLLLDTSLYTISD